MTLFRAGIAVAGVLIGAIAAFLGFVVTLSSLRTGSLSLSYGSGATAVSETILQASDPSRFWQLVILMGVVPLVLGVIAARWGYRRLKA
ncbi:MAG: hypothetical protein ACRCS9_13760 [Hyphomicrobium sp.]